MIVMLILYSDQNGIRSYTSLKSQISNLHSPIPLCHDFLILSWLWKTFAHYTNQWTCYTLLRLWCVWFMTSLVIYTSVNLPTHNVLFSSPMQTSTRRCLIIGINLNLLIKDFVAEFELKSEHESSTPHHSSSLSSTTLNVAG